MSNDFLIGRSTESAVQDLYDRVIRLEEAVSSGGTFEMNTDDEASYNAQVEAAKADLKASEDARTNVDTQYAQAEDKLKSLEALKKKKSDTSEPTPTPTPNDPRDSTPAPTPNDPRDSTPTPTPFDPTPTSEPGKDTFPPISDPPVASPPPIPGETPSTETPNTNVTTPPSTSPNSGAPSDVTVSTGGTGSIS